VIAGQGGVEDRGELISPALAAAAAAAAAGGGGGDPLVGVEMWMSRRTMMIEKRRRWDK
jgi:hypothetical protein